MKIKWVAPIRCNELYSAQIAEEATHPQTGQQFFTSEFSDTEWICPDTTDLRIGRNAFEYVAGAVFTMVVNECNIAQ